MNTLKEFAVSMLLLCLLLTTIGAYYKISGDKTKTYIRTINQKENTINRMKFQTHNDLIEFSNSIDYSKMTTQELESLKKLLEKY
jgi:uncharacterized protein (UPF0333 family)